MKLRTKGKAMSTQKGRIVNQGMGGFLNPPGHPEHTRSVEFDLRRKPENRGSMSLSHALECDWLDGLTKAQARRLLEVWSLQKRPLSDSTVQDWIQQVLGYFRGCYAGQNAKGEQSWNVSDLRIDQNVDPLLNADIHAGVHLIRKYYPEYSPKAEDFKQAYWGTKPETTETTK